jgi:RimJ/RimL family protein N-acetyltransferase
MTSYLPTVPTPARGGFLLETERLIIADWDGAEIPAFRPIASDPAVMRYIGTGSPWSDARITAFVERQISRGMRGELALWKVIERNSGRLIGLCGLQPLLETGEIEIGWWLTPDRWGRGLATEAATRVLRYALDSRGLDRVIAITQVPNLASQRVAAKIGLRYVATLPFGDLGGEPPTIPIALFSTDGRLPRSIDPYLNHGVDE